MRRVSFFIVFVRLFICLVLSVLSILYCLDLSFVSRQQCCWSKDRVGEEREKCWFWFSGTESDLYSFFRYELNLVWYFSRRRLFLIHCQLEWNDCYNFWRAFELREWARLFRHVFLSFTKKILSFVNGMLRIVFLLLRVSDWMLDACYISVVFQSQLQLTRFSTHTKENFFFFFVFRNFS